MAEPTLLAGAALALFVAAVYGYVGRRLGRRRPPGEAALAASMFTVWWYSIAAVSSLGAATSIAAWLGQATLPLMVAVAHLALLLVCIALWGLLYYLVYLFTGRSGPLVPLAGFYVAYFGVLAYLLAAAGPAGVEVGRWSARLDFTNPLSGPIVGAALALLVVPQVAGALAYFSLVFRLRDRGQRFRVAVVSWSIVAWFLTTSFASRAFGDQDWWQLTSRAIGVAAAVAILFAYQPPAWLRRWLGTEASAAEEAA